MDFNLARFNMVQQQVRPWDVSLPQVLDLLATIPREHFVPTEFQQLAFSDTYIPIGFGQVMLPPKIVGRLLQALNIDHQESVLEIGTGTGYITALISELAKKVVSLEIIPELSLQAKERLTALDLHNIHLVVENGVEGYMPNAPFDVIVMTGSLPYLPKILREQLSVGGRLFAFIGELPIISAVSLTRVGKEHWKEQILFETDVPSLNHTLKQTLFQF